MNEVTYAVNGVELRTIDEGEGPLVVLCHGFPELAYSWRHQIPALVAAGYRVLAPDQRGYGGSSRPTRVDDYAIDHLMDDLLGLLDAVGEEKAVFVGHDWGALVVWTMAQRHPERVRAVVGMSVPFLPRPTRPPIATMAEAFGDTFFYMVWFQRPDEPEADFEADPHKTMRRFLTGLTGDPATAVGMFAPYSEGGMVGRLPEPAGLPDWITQEEVDHYGDEFARSGFFGPVSWYRNMDANWERNADIADAKVEMPALFVTGADDPVGAMAPADRMDGWVTDLRGTVSVPGAGHWVQQEKPAEVNEALLTFLQGL